MAISRAVCCTEALRGGYLAHTFFTQLGHSISLPVLPPCSLIPLHGMGMTVLCQVPVPKQGKAECNETPPKAKGLSISAGMCYLQPLLERDTQKVALCQGAFMVVW